MQGILPQHEEGQAQAPLLPCQEPQHGRLALDAAYDDVVTPMVPFGHVHEAAPRFQRGARRPMTCRVTRVAIAMRARVLCGMMPWDVQPIAIVLIVSLEHPDLDAESLQ